MFDRIAALLKKEFLQVFRDPRMKIVIFVSPMIQIFIFGYAATMDITNAPIAIHDRDNTKESRALIRDFDFSPYFDLKYGIQESAQETTLINKSKVLGILKIDKPFARNLLGNNDAEVQLIVDGTDSNAASIVLGYANSIVHAYNYRVMRERADTYLDGYAGSPFVQLEDRKWFNQNLISRNYYLPGVIVMIVTVMSLLLSAMAVVREKEIGTMEQIIVSPLRPFELIIGKITPFAVIALVQVTLITTIGHFWFDVPVRGSIFLLFFCTLLYLLTTLGAGLFFSTLCNTQQEALMSAFLFVFPASLLSGFAYPIANMPKIIQYVTFINPMRYFMTIVRYIFLKGVGVGVLWEEMLALLIIGTVVLTASSRRFRKNLG